MLTYLQNKKEGRKKGLVGNNLRLSSQEQITQFALMLAIPRNLPCRGQTAAGGNVRGISNVTLPLAGKNGDHPSLFPTS